MKIAIRDKEYALQFSVNDDVGKKVMTYDTSKQTLLNIVNKKYGMNFILKDTEIIDLTNKHLCKYCGEVANGPDEDVLCKDCRDTFGHAFYSEL